MHRGGFEPLISPKKEDLSHPTPKKKRKRKKNKQKGHQKQNNLDLAYQEEDHEKDLVIETHTELKQKVSWISFFTSTTPSSHDKEDEDEEDLVLEDVEVVSDKNKSSWRDWLSKETSNEQFQSRGAIWKVQSRLYSILGSTTDAARRSWVHKATSSQPTMPRYDLLFVF